MKLNTEQINKNLNMFKNGDKSNGAKSNGNATNGNSTNSNSTNGNASNGDKSASQVTGEQQPPASDLDINTLIFNRSTEYQVISEVSRHKLCEPVYVKYRVRAGALFSFLF